MGKILITLKVPSVEQKFDVLVPDFLPVKDVIPLMAEAVSELTKMMYVSSGAEVLCRDDPSEIFNGEYTLRDYGVADGEYLFLI